MKTRLDRSLRKPVVYLVLLLYALTILVPFYVIVITSFKTNADSSSIPFRWWPAEGFHADGYKNVLLGDASTAFRGSSILRGFFNTMWMVVPTTLLGILTSSVSAYAFSKLRFPGKNHLFSVLLFTMMIPGVVTLTPAYLIYDTIGWVDTPFPLMIPGMLGNASCVFFMRQYYNGIPNSLVEAAKIDGMSYVKIFFVIMAPLSVPALLTQGIIGFIGGYNDYLGPLLYLQSSDLYTLQIALKFSMSTYYYDWQTVMAGAVLALLPTLLLYVFCQKYFIKGIAMSGLKA